MNSESFDTAMQLIFGNEGSGITNLLDDPGGLTKMGITYKIFLKFKKDGTEEDLKNLTDPEAKAIYKKLFWDALNLEDLFDDKIAAIIFDQTVNRGLSAAVKDVQDALGVPSDGVFGPKTLKALKSITQEHASRTQFLFDFIVECQKSYIRIARDPSKLQFLAGWINRTHLLYRYVKGTHE